ncbi:hypothetical protein ABW21_db0207449 [Orbilia brochopaga]|nr:hypothetical protein ABW21_db0207449 [Drechslerella brochopaga]
MDEPAEDSKLIFNKTFTAEAKALADAIARLPDTRATDRQPSLDAALSRIAELTRALQDAAIYLPSYDQKIYTGQLKSLEEQLAAARRAIAPRTRFAFKSRRTAAADVKPSESPAATTDTSTTISTPPANPPAVTTDTSYAEEPVDPRTATLTGRRNAHLTAPSATATTTILTITSLTSCIVHPPTTSTSTDTSTSVENARFTSLSVQNITDSILLCGRIDGPAHLTGLQGCIVVVKCRQFRLHECRDVVVYLRCRSRPIIEHCHGITFAPLVVDGGEEEEGENMWDQVDDFNWLKEGKPSPNWRVSSAEERMDEAGWRRIADTTVDVRTILSDLLPKP